MQEIQVDKADLIEILEHNKSSHRAKYEEAFSAYRKAAIAQLNQWLDGLKEGKRVHLFSDLPVPTDHTESYERILGMLRMDINDKVTVNETEYQRYVLDKWEWTRQFSQTRSAYALEAEQDSEQW